MLATSEPRNIPAENELWACGARGPFADILMVRSDRETDHSMNMSINGHTIGETEAFHYW